MATNKPRLNRSAIVATAIQIADVKGLDDVTLRGIASWLGVHVTSLYNHVATKDEVLEEMVKALVAEAKLPTGTVSWPEWVRKFAIALRALGRKHPGAFEAFHYASAQGDRAAESFEAAFAAFKADGFDAVSSYNAVKSTTVAVLGLVLEDMARARNPGSRTDVKKLSADRFPLIHEIGRVAAKADAFPYLVEALIAGFEANRKSARSRSATQVRATKQRRKPAASA